MKLVLAQISRNAQGKTTRVERTIEGDSIRIGRAADSALHLEDARAPKHAATLESAAAGDYAIRAQDIDLNIDGRFERASVLSPGQVIRISPYTITVEACEGDHIKLALELIVTEVPRATRTAMSLGEVGISKRMLSWLLALPTLLIFLAWPVLHAMQDKPAGAPTRSSADQPWDPGPLDSGHATFGSDCAKCHQTPFVQVQNEACESCHRQIGWHFALDTPQAQKTHDAVFTSDTSGGRCAACHRDHKGFKALKRQDAPLCTECHSKLGTKHPGIGQTDIADFVDKHPPFRLSMRRWDPAKGAPVTSRVAQKDKPQERSNLRFPHDVHLDASGVRSPGGRLRMQCTDCHEPDAVGVRFKPIEMKRHCQACHLLSFEPAAPAREAPHGNVGEVATAVGEFYSHAMVTGMQVDRHRLTLSGNTSGDKKTNSVLAWMMGKEGTCGMCHTITQTQKAGKQEFNLLPVVQNSHWMPKARFQHTQHNTFDCRACHAATQSSKSEDILIPDIANCRECHGGNEPVADKARGTCETCHGFHVAGSRSSQPAVAPAVDAGRSGPAMRSPHGGSGNSKGLAPSVPTPPVKPPPKNDPAVKG